MTPPDAGEPPRNEDLARLRAAVLALMDAAPLSQRLHNAFLFHLVRVDEQALPVAARQKLLALFDWVTSGPARGSSSVVLAKLSRLPATELARICEIVLKIYEETLVERGRAHGDA